MGDRLAGVNLPATKDQNTLVFSQWRFLFKHITGLYLGEHWNIELIQQPE